MGFPIKVCVACGEEFELKPGKPGFANRCPECSQPEGEEAATDHRAGGANKELNAARRGAIRDLLYRKEN